MVLPSFPGYPTTRPRRLRTSASLRRLTADVSVRPSDLILPMFVREGIAEPRADRVDAGGVPTQHRVPAQGRARGGPGRRRRAHALRRAASKDARGSGADDPDGVLNLAWPRCAPISATTPC